MHSPCALSNGPETKSWDPDSDGKNNVRRTALAERSVPSPAALQDTTSQDTQSSGVHSGTFSFYKHLNDACATDPYAVVFWRITDSY